MVKTEYIKSVLKKDISLDLYEYLVETIEWEEGIRSKKGFTRKAKSIITNQIPIIDKLIEHVLKRKYKTDKYIVLGYYLNYYENGEMWTPNHSHRNTHQLVISLGETRKLVINKKEYIMETGDAILFGSSVHGVPKDDTTNGRISIATFMIPTNLS